MDLHLIGRIGCRKIVATEGAANRQGEMVHAQKRFGFIHWGN
jgi:hypothetical protein